MSITEKEAVSNVEIVYWMQVNSVMMEILNQEMDAQRPVKQK
jgi:hypothetical protein